MLADGDLVMAHVHVIFEPGSPGLAVVDIFRIENGQIAEHWDVAQPVNNRTEERQRHVLGQAGTRETCRPTPQRNAP